MNIPRRKDIIKQAKEKGDKIAAVMPIHYPRALLRAYGFQPIELWGPPHVDHMGGVQHFPEYTCDIVHKSTYFLNSDEAKDVACTLIPHTCDSLQGMASVINDFIKPQSPILTLYHPRGRRKSDFLFMEKELKSLSAKLETVSGKSPSDSELLEHIRLENEAITVFEKVAMSREQYSLTDREFYTLLRSREYLPAETFIELAQKIPAGKPDLKGPGIMLSGIVPEPMALFDHINRFGAHVICDDLACCSRRIYQPCWGDDPISILANQMLSMPPDTTISTPFAERFAYLKKRVNEKGAQGMLVYNIKFCEPELFYMPLLEKAMKDISKPFLFIETELSDELSHQILNRINAFVEVLS